MSAVYEARFRRTPDGPWENAAEREPRDYQEAREAAYSVASFLKPPVAEVWDGVMTLDRWEKGTEVHVRHEADGHPDGCSCGDCGNRLDHLRAGSHDAVVCEHRTCRKCGRCGECDEADQLEAEDKYLVTLVNRLGDQVSAAMAEIGKAERTLRELMGSEVYDIELVESYDGEDLKGALIDADQTLRGARRIVEARKILLGEVPGGE